MNGQSWELMPSKLVPVRFNNTKDMMFLDGSLPE